MNGDLKIFWKINIDLNNVILLLRLILSDVGVQTPSESNE